MFDVIAIALIGTLLGALGWAIGVQALLRRQLAKQRQAPQKSQATQPPEAEDITTNTVEQLQQALKESDRRLNATRNAVEDMLYDLEISSGTLQWNEALYATGGYQHSEPANTVEWWAEHIHPDDAMKLNELMEGLANPSATGWEVEYRFRKADESYLWVHDHAFVLRNQQGEPVRLIGAMHQISPPPSPSTQDRT